MAAILVSVLCAIAGVVGLETASAPPASAAPGSPGVPQAPTVVTLEDFENNPQPGVIGLTSYVGARGQTYTAERPWLSQSDCNGTILTYSQNPTQCVGNANNQASNNIRRLADVLGQVGAGVVGGTDAAPVNRSTAETRQNHALSEFTLGIDPAAGSVEFRSNGPIYTTDESHFYTFSVDVAELSCYFDHSLLDFELQIDGGSYPAHSAPIEACADPGTRSYTSPSLSGGFGSGGSYVRAGTYTANSSWLVQAGQPIGVILRNQTASAYGNDHAIDNVRLLDSTPQLDKQFSPQLVETGDTSTLTFTVTNTTELSAKDGWSFVDTLPSGLVIADQPGVGGTCVADTTATAGDDTISVANGQLAAGQTSCTVTVRVTSQTAGSYTNGPGNVTEVGLLPPGGATVAFTDPSYTVEKTATTHAVHPGDTIGYTVTVKNTGAWAYDDRAPAGLQRATFTDDLSDVLDDATYNDDASGGATVSGNTLSWSGALGVGQTVAVTYSVTVNDPDTGDQVMRNAVVPTAPGGECASTDACTTRTPLKAFTLEKTTDVTQAVPGQKVTYTVTVTNTGQSDYTAQDPASFTDDLSDVLSRANYNGDVSGGATVSGNTLSWSGELAVGETRVVTYSVTVKPDATGAFRNVVITPPASGANCAAGSTDQRCSVTVTVDPVAPAAFVPPAQLAKTEASGGPRWVLPAGIALCLAGAGLLVVARRRRSTHAG